MNLNHSDLPMEEASVPKTEAVSGIGRHDQQSEPRQPHWILSRLTLNRSRSPTRGPDPTFPIMLQ